MKSVVRFSLKQTVFLNVVFVILVIAGAFSILTIPVENMPTVDIGRVFIYTPYFGASAEDVEQLVTIKIEDALDGLEDVEFIQARSFRNFSSVSVKFIDDVDYKDRYDELRFRTLNIKDELPEGVDEPSFFYIDTHMWLPVIITNISGEIPQQSLKLYAQELKSQLLGIPNVRNVELVGEYDREFHVSVDPAKLRMYGITFNQVASAIESANVKIPTGRYKKDATEFMLDAGRRLSSQQEVLDIIVRRDGDGNFIRVRDLVTNARMSFRDPITIPSVNGNNTLRLRVIKAEKGDSIIIAREVKRIAREFGQAHAAGDIQIVFTNDSTFEINDSINTLGGNLMLGMVLVVIILWVSLGFRNAMITAIGIPFSFLCTIVIMYISSVSLNTISLAAFVLVTGIMVDDAVIIVENIFRHVQMGKPKKEAIIDGTSEVMLPVISAALTTALAFLPMLIMTGSTGDFFSIIPKTITFALAASLIEALLIVPLHFHDWGPSPVAIVGAAREDTHLHLPSGIFAPLWKIYVALVEKLLNHKIMTLASVFALFIVSVTILILSASGAVPLIKVKFFPGNYFRYHVTAAMPVGTTIEQTDLLIRDLSRFIISLGPGQADSASGNAGFYEDKEYNRFSGGNYGEIVVTLPEGENREFPDNPDNDPMIHLDHIKNAIKEYVEASYPAERRPFVTVFEESDGPPAGKPVNIRVSSLTIEDSLKATQKVRAFMKDHPELKDLADLEDDRPYLHKTVRFIPRQEKIFEYGLNQAQVTSLVAGALNGYNAGNFRAVDEEVDLMVRLARKDDAINSQGRGLSSPLDILDVPVVEHSASPILLRDLVEASYVSEPNKRSRYQGRPTITITSDISGGSKLSPARVQYLVNDFMKKSGDQFANSSLSYGGEFETTRKSYRSLTFAFLIAILLIYMVLSSQFNDYVQPVMILTAVPFAFIGVVLGLLITRTTFTIGSFMAAVGLAGVAVNNSLLLIDFMNVRRRAGSALREAIIGACAARMRPVLITTVTTVLGLLPMAIGIPHKSLSWSPLAMAFVSGIFSSTILTLLVIPIEYELVGKLEERFSRKNRQGKHEFVSGENDGG